MTVSLRADVATKENHASRFVAKTGTMLRSAGEPLNDVAGRLGHGNPMVTLSTYAQALPQNQRRTANRVAEVPAVGT